MNSPTNKLHLEKYDVAEVCYHETNTSSDCLALFHQYTSRALMEGINMEKSSQGCYKAMQLSQ